jgi:alcohol dehydrogenase (cytochrome c)
MCQQKLWDGGMVFARQCALRSLAFLLVLTLWGGTDGLAQNRQQNLTQLQSDDGQWVMPAKNYASTRYSSLHQITTENVSRLMLAWTFSTGVVNSHEAAPIVVNNTMYVITLYPNVL